MHRADHGALLTSALLVVTAVGCATIASLNAAGEALQDAGYEMHDLLMEEDGVVSADLERPDGATDEEHFHEAAAILWEQLHDDAQQAEIRIRSDDDVDRTTVITVAALTPARRPLQQPGGWRRHETVGRSRDRWAFGGGASAWCRRGADEALLTSPLNAAKFALCISAGGARRG